MARKTTKAGTPAGTPDGTPKDRRPSMTFRGPEYTPEFRALVAKAAEKAGSTQSAFVHRVLTEASQRVLRGEPAVGEPPGASVPVVTPDALAARDARLLERMQAMIAEAVRPAPEPERRGAVQRLGEWLRRRGRDG